MCAIKKILGAGEVAQKLRALAAFSEDHGSVFCIYTVAHRLSLTPVPGIQCPPLTSEDTRYTHGAQAYIQAKHSCIHLKILNVKKINYYYWGEPRSQGLWVVVAHAFNPSTWESEAGGSL